MSSIIPVPTTRVGDYFVRQRLVGQVQNDQLDLFKLQNQISTGNRMQLPSEDAPAALRAINLPTGGIRIHSGQFDGDEREDLVVATFADDSVTLVLSNN